MSASGKFEIAAMEDKEGAFELIEKIIVDGATRTGGRLNCT